jgi:hypothetical protein
LNLRLARVRQRNSLFSTDVQNTKVDSTEKTSLSKKLNMRTKEELRELIQHHESGFEFAKPAEPIPLPLLVNVVRQLGNRCDAFLFVSNGQVQTELLYHALQLLGILLHANCKEEASRLASVLFVDQFYEADQALAGFQWMIEHFSYLSELRYPLWLDWSAQSAEQFNGIVFRMPINLP